MDQTEKYNWPYIVTTNVNDIEYSSEPVIVDFDNDGFAEVVIATWPQKGSGKWGTIRILNYQGVLLHRIDLPVSRACQFEPSNCASSYSG